MKKPSRRLAISSRKTKLITAICVTSVLGLILFGVTNQASATNTPANCSQSSIATTISVDPLIYFVNPGSFEIEVQILNTGSNNCLITIFGANEFTTVRLPNALGIAVDAIDLRPTLLAKYGAPVHVPALPAGTVQLPVGGNLTVKSGNPGHVCAADMGLETCAEIPAMQHTQLFNQGVGIVFFNTQTRGTSHGTLDSSPPPLPAARRRVSDRQTQE